MLVFSEKAFWNCPFSISAVSVGSECKVPSDLRGGICLPSDLQCFIKVENLFIQFGLSFAWSLSGGETILSMYFQYAFLISLCVCRLSSLNLASSLLFLDFFFLLYHLSLFRIRRLMSGVIHGLPSFFLVIFMGTFSPV
jgi:hypothetical protein